MKLVVGLGNPGPRYNGTRHNIGFAVLDYLVAGSRLSSWRSRFESDVAEMVESVEHVLLVKPQTFMNLSGRAVWQFVDFYKLPLNDLLVICDDIALPTGKLRVRAKGSDGGQKGLRSIQGSLGTDEYARLRIGVGSPDEQMDAADYVLSRFKPGERDGVEDAIAKAAQGVLTWVRSGIDVCMNQVNGEPKPKPKKPKAEKRAADGEKGDKGDDKKNATKPEN
jgi:PTH1 family peptidyl-tRNA hydrolase